MKIEKREQPGHSCNFMFGHGECGRNAQYKVTGGKWLCREHAEYAAQLKNIKIIGEKNDGCIC